MTDLIAGRIPMMVEIESVLAPQAKDGKVRVLATTGPARSALLPDVPTVSEAGIRDFVVQGWLGIVGARGLAPDVVSRLNAALRQALNDPQTVEAIEKRGRSGACKQCQRIRCPDRRRYASLVEAGSRCEDPGAVGG